MATLTGKTIANTYKDLLQVSNSNSGVDATLRTIQDGEGTNSALQISTGSVNINGTFQLGGETLTATVSALNNIADLTGATGLVAVSGGSVYGRSIAVGSPLSVTNADGTEGNPTISLAASGVSAGSYGPMSSMTIDTYGRVTDVTATTTVSANAFIGGTLSGSSLYVENNVSVSGTLNVAGMSNLGTVSASDIVADTVSATTKIFAPIVSTTGLHATSASIGSLYADTLTFTNVSTNSFTANQLTVVSAATLAGVSIANVNELAALSATMATSIDNTNTNVTTNINAITSINAVVSANIDSITSINTIVSGLDTEISVTNDAITSVNAAVVSVNSAITSINAVTDTLSTSITANESAITSINNVVANLSSTMATSIGNTNTNLTALSATMATSINNTNANVTTNINAITSINNVVANLSSTLATSISNHMPKSGGTFTGDVTFSTSVFAAADPTQNLQLATKQYVDNLVASSLHFHDAVRVESPNSAGNLNATYDNGTAGVGATLTNAGTQAALVIDGITLNTSDRVLIYNQTNAYENGVYTVTDTGSVSTNWVLTRATDADSYEPNTPDGLDEGSYFYVSEGDTGAGESYVCNTVGTITFGTTDISFVQFSSSLNYVAGSGLNLTGLTFSTSGVPTDAELAAVSATLATSIGNTNTNLTAVSAALATSIGNSNTNIAAVSATMATSIDNTNTNLTALSATMATSIANHLALAGGTLTGHVSGTSITMSGDVSANAYYGDGSNLTGITAGATEGFAIAIAIALG